MSITFGPLDKFCRCVAHDTNNGDPNASVTRNERRVLFNREGISQQMIDGFWISISLKVHDSPG